MQRDVCTLCASEEARVPCFCCVIFFILLAVRWWEIGVEWLQLEVILFSQLFAEHLSVINRDCKMPSGEKCNRIKVASVFLCQKRKLKI